MTILNVLLIQVDTVKEEVSVPERKLVEFKALCEQFLHDPLYKYNCKLLESIRGKAVSWLLVISNCRLFIREMNTVIKHYYEHGMECFDVDYIQSTELKKELSFWMQLKPEDLVRKWHEPYHGLIKIPRLNLEEPLTEMYTDASTYKLGGVLKIDGETLVCDFGLSPLEYSQAIHVNEMRAILRCIYAFGQSLKNKRIKIFCDNQSVVSAWRGDGSRDPLINRLMIQTYELLRELNSQLYLEWISTHFQEADAPSREVSPHDDSIIAPHIGRIIRHCFAPNLDLFAESHSALVSRYVSRFDETYAIWTDAISYLPKCTDVIYCYPPRALITACLRASIAPCDKAVMVLNVFDHHDYNYLQCSKYFEYCVVIGEHFNPCCLTISTKKKNCTWHRPGYRVYKEPSYTFLMTKGYNMTEINQFATYIRDQRSYTKLNSRVGVVKRF